MPVTVKEATKALTNICKSNSRFNCVVILSAIKALIAPLTTPQISPIISAQKLETLSELRINFTAFLAFVVVIAILFALIIGGGTRLFLNNQIESLSQNQKKIQRSTTDYETKFKDFTKNKQKNIFPVLEKIITENEATINVFEALSVDIPDNIYIKKFVTNASGGIGILGEAQTSESVNEFVNSLREKNSDLMLSKLSVNSQNDFNSNRQNTSFSFEIKTSKQSVSFDDAVLQDTVQTIQRKPSSSRRGSMTPPPPVI